MAERSVNLDTARKIALILRGVEQCLTWAFQRSRYTETHGVCSLPSLGGTRLAADKSRSRHRAALLAEAP